MAGNMIDLTGVDPTLLIIGGVSAIEQQRVEAERLEKLAHRDTGIMLEAKHIHLHRLWHWVEPIMTRKEENSECVEP